MQRCLFVWCSSFRISHSLETMHYPTGSIHEALELSPVLLGGAADSASSTQPSRTAKVMRRRICALMGNTFPAKAPNFVSSTLTLRICPSSELFPRAHPGPAALQTKGSSERSSLSAGAQPSPARGCRCIPPPSQPACPGDRAGSAAPPAAEPRTDLSELAGEVQEGDGHAHGLQEHGGHQHGPAGLRGAGAARRQHPGAGLGAPGAAGLTAAVPRRMQPRAQPARGGWSGRGGAEGPSPAVPSLFSLF